MSEPYNTQVAFCRALAVVRALPERSALQPTAADKLNLYGLYKQATLGDCNIPRPSSSQMVHYAKWKAWDRRRGLSPTEAQRLYINALTELLVEFIGRYPHHEQTPSLTESLRYLQNDTSTEEQEIALDAWKREKEEYYLGHVGPHQLHDHVHDHDTASSVNYPATPDLSPAPQRTLQKFVRPSDFLALDGTSVSEADREVAKTTASLNISSPSHHPYYEPSLQVPSSSERVLESLQTEVAALSEQLYILKQNMAEREERRQLLRWSSTRFIRSIAKHTLINSLILLIVFLILWRRKSPIAYSIIAYVGPQFQDIVRYFVRRIVFWKVSV